MFNFGTDGQLPTILLVDDDMVSREVMATVLTMAGYSMHTADEGPAALRLLRSGHCKPQVILMDTQMPGLSGAALVSELRALSSARIVAISASAPPPDVLAAADGYLLKPFDAQALRALLEAAQPAPQPAAPDDPVISPATLAQLRGLMEPPALRQVYSAVVADLHAKIAALEIAIAAADTAEVKRLGHALKGGCGMAGAMQAARLGARLETGGDQLDNSASLLIELRQAASALERMLEAEFPA